MHSKIVAGPIGVLNQCKDFIDDMSVNVCQAAVDTVLVVDQSFMVDAQQVQHGGVEVVAIRVAFGRFVSPLVTSTVATTGLFKPAAAYCLDRGATISGRASSQLWQLSP